jgi:DNA-binding PadR family transcriptional regulator
MQAEMEITKQKEQVKGDTKDVYRQTEAEQQLLQNVMGNEAATKKKEMQFEIQKARNQLQSNKKNS